MKYLVNSIFIGIGCSFLYPLTHNTLVNVGIALILITFANND
jgi:hypothetical protein